MEAQGNFVRAICINLFLATFPYGNIHKQSKKLLHSYLFIDQSIEYIKLFTVSDNRVSRQTGKFNCNFVYI
jgi:hypothetical protein